MNYFLNEKLGIIFLLFIHLSGLETVGSQNISDTLSGGPTISLTPEGFPVDCTATNLDGASRSSFPFISLKLGTCSPERILLKALTLDESLYTGQLQVAYLVDSPGSLSMLSENVETAFNFLYDPRSDAHRMESYNGLLDIPGIVEGANYLICAKPFGFSDSKDCILIETPIGGAFRKGVTGLGVQDHNSTHVSVRWNPVNGFYTGEIYNISTTVDSDGISTEKLIHRTTVDLRADIRIDGPQIVEVCVGTSTSSNQDFTCANISKAIEPLKIELNRSNSEEITLTWDKSALNPRRRYFVEFSCFSTAKCHETEVIDSINCPDGHFINDTDDEEVFTLHSDDIWVSASIFSIHGGNNYSVGTSLLPPSNQDFNIHDIVERHSIEFVWERFRFEWVPTTLKVNCTDGSESFAVRRENMLGCQVRFLVQGLKSNTDHFCNLEFSSPSSKDLRSWNFTTKPGECVGIEFSDIEVNGNRFSKTFTVRWKLLTNLTGIIDYLNFVILDLQYRQIFRESYKCRSNTTQQCLEFCKPDGECTFKETVQRLRPDKTYNAYLECQYERGDEATPSKKIEFKTSADVPKIQKYVLYLRNMKISENTFTEMRIYINRQNIDFNAGRIIKLEAVYAERGSLSKPDALAWPVRTARSVEADNSTEFKITVFNNQTSFILRSLKPHTEYSIKLRYFTHAGYAESFLMDFRTSEKPLLMEVFGTAMVLLLVLLLCVAFIANPNPKYDMRFVNLDNTVTIHQRYPILLSDLVQSIERLISGKELEKQYEELVNTSPKRNCVVAQYPGNMIKNRYANILTFDFSRVVLKELPLHPYSDYINASYIHGYKKMYKFIASQGPLHSTRRDFWRMIWEKDIKIIVMLTSCVENGREKCSKYWPSISTSGTIDDEVDEKLYIENLGEEIREKEGFTIRKFKVARNVLFLPRKRSTSKIITQFHFNSWPDFDCPQRPSQLVNLVMKIREATPVDSSHILVHCSAGVGRSGTYILIDTLIDELRDGTTKEIDIFAHVMKMRHFRTNIIQTVAQYIFVHRCAVLLKAMDSWNGKIEALEELEAKYPFILNRRRLSSSRMKTSLNPQEISEDEDLIPLSDSDEELIDGKQDKDSQDNTMKSNSIMQEEKFEEELDGSKGEKREDAEDEVGKVTELMGGVEEVFFDGTKDGEKLSSDAQEKPSAKNS